MQLKAHLQRKPDNFELRNCVVEKIVELEQYTFEAFLRCPLDDRDFITENRELMYERGEVAHCLLVLGEGSDAGVLVESEGSTYARYAAYVAGARTLVERELADLAEECMAITPDDNGSISIYLEDIEAHTGAVVTDDSYHARAFFEILQKHPAVKEVEGFDDVMVITPTNPPVITLDAADHEVDSPRMEQQM